MMMKNLTSLLVASAIVSYAACAILGGRSQSAGLLGGVNSIDTTDKYTQEAANWAVEQINGASNSMFRFVLQEIADGSRQVVNGYKYRFLLYLATSTCRNKPENSGKGLDACPLGENSMRQQCDVSVVWSQGEYSLLDHKCKPLKKAKNILGGDSHDYVPHGTPKKLLGGDGHDYVPHGTPKKLLGGDSHDYVPHGTPKKLLGGDGHDYVPHGVEIKHILLGGDGHDYKQHLLKTSENLLGQGIHDYIPHVKNSYRGLMNTLAHRFEKDIVMKKGEEVLKAVVDNTILGGGDSHDYEPHGFVDQCEEHRVAFEAFKTKHERLYASSQVEAEKFQIFCGNMERVKEFQKMERGSAVYGVTQFADISEKEFKDTYLGWKQSPSNAVPSWPEAQIPTDPIPSSWDWRDHGAVTPVKNQGQCGSCWAFSTTGNIEGMNAIKHGKLVSLSEQELLDCDTTDEACNGGLPSQAYQAIMKLGGIETEKDYSYDADKESCKFKKSKIAAKLTGAVNISQNEDEIAAWLHKNGPISIGINAFAMQFYMGGIAHPWEVFCNPKSLDHGVLIVGYGTDGDEPYWIVKNSWGPGWGRQGYYYVYRGDGTCGLNTMCTSAVVQ